MGQIVIRKFAFLLASASMLVACGGGGPSKDAILAGTTVKVGGSQTTASAATKSPYVLVEVDRSIAKTVSDQLRKEEVGGFIGLGKPDHVVIGRGDIVEVAIVSTTNTGYLDFTTASLSPISQTALVPQEVGSDGKIRVPPIGAIDVAGRTVHEVEQDLTEKLAAELVDPSAIVRIADRQSAKVAVMGKVKAPGRYSISETNLRLLDLIAAAGGTSQRSENLRVTISRKGVTRSALLETVLANPSLNVYVRPDDVVEVETPENRIVVLGGGGATNTTLTLDQPDSTLTDVLGDAKGLAGRAADRAGVFLYREVPASALHTLGADTSNFTEPMVPTVFRFDLTSPEALFVAKSFKVADGDVVYLATSLKDAIDALATFVPLPNEYIRDNTIDNTN